uniref:Uncharacterized protein n=1 Tax=viral metagenome TaxID=1070528 RepID=A0A6M3LKN3_9ZZZZ
MEILKYTEVENYLGYFDHNYKDFEVASIYLTSENEIVKIGNFISTIFNIPRPITYKRLNLDVIKEDGKDFETLALCWTDWENDIPVKHHIEMSIIGSTLLTLLHELTHAYEPGIGHDNNFFINYKKIVYYAESKIDFILGCAD